MRLFSDMWALLLSSTCSTKSGSLEVEIDCASKMEDLIEFDELKGDFEKIVCRISVRGGMKKRGHTEHDLDLDVRLEERKNLLAAFSKMTKWNRIFRNKYGIFLDVWIYDAGGRHIYDFDGRLPFFMRRPWERAIIINGKVFKEDTRK